MMIAELFPVGRRAFCFVFLLSGSFILYGYMSIEVTKLDLKRKHTSRHANVHFAFDIQKLF